MDVVRREEVFKGIGCTTRPGRRAAGIVSAVTGGIVEVEGQSGFPRRVIKRVADPIPGGPGIDVQTLLLALASPDLSHLPELPSGFVREVEPALAYFDSVPDHMTSLIRMLGRTKTLSRVVRRTITILVHELEFGQLQGLLVSRRAGLLRLLEPK